MAAARSAGALNLQPELSLMAAIFHEHAGALQGPKYLDPDFFEPQGIATTVLVARGSTYTILRKQSRPSHYSVDLRLKRMESKSRRLSIAIRYRLFHRT